MKKLNNNQGVKLSSTLAGQRELIREMRNTINALIDAVEAMEKDIADLESRLLHHNDWHTLHDGVVPYPVSEPKENFCECNTRLPEYENKPGDTCPNCGKPLPKPNTV